MKKIEALIRPESVEAVKLALRQIDHRGLTVVPASGHGAQGGVRQKWRLKEYVVDLIPKALVMVVVTEDRLEPTLEAIVSAARTGSMGDGKIFVTDVVDVLRISTGDRGSIAL